MTLTISPPLIQQLQPRFLELRNIYTSRERNSKIYSWLAFVCAAILPELPWSFIAGTLYWAAWYWPPHFPRDSYTSAVAWLFVCLFEVTTPCPSPVAEHRLSDDRRCFCFPNLHVTDFTLYRFGT